LTESISRYAPEAMWTPQGLLKTFRIHSLAVKDSRWEIGDNGSAKAAYCPLGEGFAQFPVLLEMLSGSSFRGPVSMHFEYPLGGAEHGARELSISPEQVKTAMKKDFDTFQSQTSFPAEA